ncbi:MAG: hypothetical protein INR71_01810 [Terriglobus roseus]|nr:hypothetical protein [Terriglobus roseus]
MLNLSDHTLKRKESFSSWQNALFLAGIGPQGRMPGLPSSRILSGGSE